MKTFTSILNILLAFILVLKAPVMATGVTDSLSPKSILNSQKQENPELDKRVDALKSSFSSKSNRLENALSLFPVIGSWFVENRRILLICFLIFIHELGHFLAAKASGIPIARFSIGFGPVLISRKIIRIFH